MTTWWATGPIQFVCLRLSEKQMTTNDRILPKEPSNITSNVTGQQPRLVYSPNENIPPAFVCCWHGYLFLARRRSNCTASPTATETDSRAWWQNLTIEQMFPQLFCSSGLSSCREVGLSVHLNQRYFRAGTWTLGLAQGSSVRNKPPEPEAKLLLCPGQHHGRPGLCPRVKQRQG